MNRSFNVNDDKKVDNNATALTLSNRAQTALNIGLERPTDMWSRNDIRNAVAETCDYLGIRFYDSIMDSLSLDDMRSVFLEKTGIHHMNKESVQFSWINIDAVIHVFSDNVLEVLKSDAYKNILMLRISYKSDIAYGDSPDDEDDDEYVQKREELRNEYMIQHGYASNSVKAYMEEHSDDVSFGFSDDNKRIVIIRTPAGGEFKCALDNVEAKFVSGYDATSGKLKEWNVNRLRSYRETLQNEYKRIGGESA